MLTLRAFGELDLRDAAGAPLTSVLTQPKRSALLAYLLLSRPGGLHRRDALLALFWPELDQEHGRMALNQALTFLRHNLGGEVLATRGSEEVGVDPSRIHCDVLAFGELLRKGQWGEALELCRGDLLEGLHVKEAPEFSDWVDRERVRLREEAAGAAWRWAHQLIAEGKPVEAERKAQRALQLAPTEETPVREFIVALAAAGERGAALRFYEKFRGMLERELGVEPAPETEAAARGVRNGGFRGVERSEAERSQGAGADEARASSGAAPELQAPRLSRPPPAAVLAFVAVVMIAGLAAAAPWLRRLASGAEDPAYPRTAIAVLPFENLSSEGPHAYFAGGLYDELLTQLSRVASVSLRGRTSVMGYARTSKPIPVIAEELSVGTVVEGSVQVVGDRLRVNVQLIDAATEAVLWAERYDRPMDDAFAVQSEIAGRIAAAVGATLTRAEIDALAAAPTRNAEAYRFYLQGLEYWRRPGLQRRSLETAQGLFERAIALDSTFALAYAALSRVHGQMSWLRFDPSPDRLARQREAAEAALRLEPDLPQAHAAVGYLHYTAAVDYRAALDEYRIALRSLPNDAELWEQVGDAHRRLGEWSQVLSCIERVVSLDPRNSDALGNLAANTMLFLRRYPEAIDYSRRAYELAPDAPVSEIQRARAWVTWRGRLDSLAVALGRLPPGADLGPLGPPDLWRAHRLLLARQPDSVLAVVARSPSDAFVSQTEYVPTALYAAWAHRLRGDEAAARAAFESARAHLDSVLAVSPAIRVHASSGLALAGLGLKREAAAEARWLQERPRFVVPYAGFGSRDHDALIFAQIGDVEGAVAALERVLSGGSASVSAHTVRLDPRYDPIRDDPRFQALLARFAEPKPVW